METFKFKIKSITGNTPLAALKPIWVPNTSNEVLKSLLFFDSFVKYSYKNYEEFLILCAWTATGCFGCAGLLLVFDRLRSAAGWLGCLGRRKLALRLRLCVNPDRQEPVELIGRLHPMCFDHWLSPRLKFVRNFQFSWSIDDKMRRHCLPVVCIFTGGFKQLVELLLNLGPSADVDVLISLKWGILRQLNDCILDLVLNDDNVAFILKFGANLELFSWYFAKVWSYTYVV